jgi:hypothetical protein
MAGLIRPMRWTGTPDKNTTSRHGRRPAGGLHLPVLAKITEQALRALVFALNKSPRLPANVSKAILR